MGKVVKIVVVVAVVFFVLTAVKNTLIQSVLASSISKAANVPVHIGGTDVKFLQSSIRLTDVRLANPRSFPERKMLDMPELAIRLDVGALTKGQAHFPEVRLNVR